MSDSMSQLPAASPYANYIQPNLGHGLRIWWAFFWPTTLITGILTAVLNYSIRRIYPDSGLPGNLLGSMMKFDPYVLTYIVALFVLDYVLQKNFRHFRIGLLSNRGGEGAQQLQVTLIRTLPVWWTYSWRSLIYRLIITFVATIPMSVLLGLFQRIPVARVLIPALLSLAIDGAAGLFVIYSNILDEEFGEFRVCLLPPEKKHLAPATPTTTPATN
jgi:hypothetical protein